MHRIQCSHCRQRRSRCYNQCTPCKYAEVTSSQDTGLIKRSRHGFNWFDRRGTEGVGFIKALRTLLTNNLPQILPDLSCIIRTRFEQLHAGHPVIDGTKSLLVDEQLSV